MVDCWSRGGRVGVSEVAEAEASVVKPCIGVGVCIGICVGVGVGV